MKRQKSSSRENTSIERRVRERERESGRDVILLLVLFLLSLLSPAAAGRRA